MILLDKDEVDAWIGAKKERGGHWDEAMKKKMKMGRKPGPKPAKPKRRKMRRKKKVEVQE